MAEKKTNPRFVTSTGNSVYPKLTEPDTKFDAAGVYSVKLRLSPESTIKDAKGNVVGTVQEFIDRHMEDSLEAAKQEVKGRVKEADAPYVIDEETGDVVVTFKLKASGKTKAGKEFTQKPALFDAKGKPIEPNAVWGGSKLKVSFEVNPFYTKVVGAGVSLRMRAVQIIELKAGGNGQDASGFGFGEEEGYEAEDEASESGFKSEEGDSSGDDDGDF